MARCIAACFAIGIALFATAPADADDTLKLAIGQRGNWNT